MGGMKDEAKRITIPPLFPRVHVDDTGRGGLSQPFDAKTISFYKRSPTNIISADSPSTLSLSLPPPHNTARLVSSLLLKFTFVLDFVCRKMVSLHSLTETKH